MKAAAGALLVLLLALPRPASGSLPDRLELVRRSPAAADDPAEIEALSRDADASPPSPLRVEARLLVSEAWLGRLGRPDEAIRTLRLVAEDPSADELSVRLAERELVTALVARGRLSEAAKEAHAHSDRMDARFVQNVDRAVRRPWLVRGAAAVLMCFFVLAAAALTRAAKRRELGSAVRAVRAIAPLAAGFALFLALVGGALATGYESGNGKPFVLLGSVVLPIALAARAWNAVGSRGRAAQVGRAAVCALGVFAAGLLVLDVINAAYLEDFGL